MGWMTRSTIVRLAIATLPAPKHSPQPVTPSSVRTSTRCAVRLS